MIHSISLIQMFSNKYLKKMLKLEYYTYIRKEENSIGIKETQYAVRKIIFCYLGRIINTNIAEAGQVHLTQQY